MDTALVVMGILLLGAALIVLTFKTINAFQTASTNEKLAATISRISVI